MNQSAPPIIIKKLSYSDILLFGLMLLTAIFLYGAVPFVAMPTLGQALGTTVGFAQSLLNDESFSLYAKNFGYPTPMPRSFGLAGVLVTELYLAIGFSPADAYSAMAATFMSLAFFGAYKLSRYLQASSKLASLFALLWLMQPMILNHVGYSMLSLGLALLPLYFYVVIKLLVEMPATDGKLKLISFFLLICLLAIFMDGYSFMMFASGTGIFWLYLLVNNEADRNVLIRLTAPVLALGFGGSYVLYKLYVGSLDFTPAPLSFFRGWGLDLSFIVLPTKDLHWLWDILNISVERNNQQFFGDHSVWVTTFSAPIILTALVAWWSVRNQNLLSTGFLLVAAFGFYMALGPSLKINSNKQQSDQELNTLMPEELAWGPTGNAFMYEYLPGFKSMRASYRWYALALIGFWVLIVIFAARKENDSKTLLAISIPIILLITIFPNPNIVFTQAIENRNSAFKIDDDLVQPLGQSVNMGERVVFAPYRNDLLANYLAARVDFKTYNVGGDKNQLMAKVNWPATMLGYLPGGVDSRFANTTLLMLARNDADVVVLPYIDFMQAIHVWPSPKHYQEILGPVEKQLENSGLVTIEYKEFFTVVRLKPQYKQIAGNGYIENQLLSDECPKIFPLSITKRSCALPFIMGKGWHQFEKEHVWSTGQAELILPMFDNCKTTNCKLSLIVSPYGATAQRPVEIQFRLNRSDSEIIHSVKVDNSDRINIEIPLDFAENSRKLFINIPQAVSPSKLKGSADPRVLGMALFEIKLIAEN